ncbi:MAG: class I SAM-dependent methyltransferase [Maricaulis sp.]|jgi:SAM-dependent methyltransferase|nr:class I SAM-dependent methyltransferase [Maricaulis sp.]MDG2044998.1 class I SAM-dependent methyltransferase [Maricaulis sp.]
MAARPDTELDPRYGSRRLAASSTAEQVHDYFRDTYYADVDSGDKGVDIKRSMDGGEAADAQRDWMSKTLYADIAWTLSEFAPGKRILDAGCGTGDLLTELKDLGFDAGGAELAPAAASVARAKGHTVSEGAFETLSVDEPLDAILFMHVLSHAADPQAMLQYARNLLAPGGIVLIRSGNDFNPLQTVLSDDKGHGDFWVTGDHQHYFTFDSVERLLEASGFEPIYKQSDFPMEMIALMGDDFIADPSLGKPAHDKRVAFETSLPAETRRQLYRALANTGMGRCLLMAGRAR